MHAVSSNIAIRRDTDFTSCGCVSSGTGTKANPYIMSGLTITTQSAPGILIDNSAGKITKYFDIIGSTITGGSGPPTNYPGIEFIKVNGLGEITGSANTFNGNKFGVYLLNSYNVLIDGVSNSNGATINNNGVDGVAIVGGARTRLATLRLTTTG